MTAGGIETAFPLTPLQEGMLYHTIRAPAAGLFHVQCSATLEGGFVPQHFARAWALAQARHAALRTFFSWEARERPLQVVRRSASIEVALFDWSGAAEREQEARWEELLQQDRTRGFELASAPLSRVAVVCVAPQRHRLLWSTHHALLDGWSALLILDEVMRDHATMAAGLEPAHSAAPSFDRFVGWLDARDRAAADPFWRRALTGFAAPVALPGGLGVRRGSADRMRATHMLTAAGTRRVQDIAAAYRVTMSTLLMGAWAILLSRYAGIDDVMFGVTVSERPAEIVGVDRAVGLYLSTVPLRAAVRRDLTVGEWLRALQLALAEARTHAAPGLAAIQRCSDVPSGTPLFDSIVVFENFPADAMHAFVASGSAAAQRGAGLHLTDAKISVPNDVPLALLALPGERLVLDVVYDPSAVPADVAARLPAQLARLLEEFGDDAGKSPDDLAMLDAAERALLLDDWSGAAIATPPGTDVLERFERHAADRPLDVALWTVDSTVTYEALDSWANRLGQRLLHAGVGDESLVGILAERSAAAIAAMFGCLKVGAAYVALDPDAPALRLRRIVDFLDLVMVTPSLSSRLHAARTVSLDDAASKPDTQPPRAGSTSSAAYVVFTSGSTGEPKGVVVERGQLAASNAARHVYYPEPPRSFLLLSPLTVDSSIAGIYWTLGSGGSLVVPGHQAEQDVDTLARLVERAGVSHTLMVPSLYHALLEHADLPRLASLVCVIVAGEACGVDVVRLHQARLPGVALHNEYGPSEATVWATAAELTGPDGGPVTIGRPIPGARVYLLDAGLRPVPPGSVGEIFIGGAGVARGYLTMPEETAHRFLDDPFEARGRLYRTGDRARFLADGRIEFLGRVDEQLKIRGFRVEPREIESALGEHPAVRAAAVALVSARPAPAEDAATLVASLAALPVADAERLLHDVETLS